MKHGQCKKKHRGFVKRNQHIPRDVVGGNNPSRRLLPPSNTPPSDGGSEGNCVPLNETHQHQPEKTSHTKTDSGSSPPISTPPCPEGGRSPPSDPLPSDGGLRGDGVLPPRPPPSFSFFFRRLPTINVQQLQMSEESLYSMTPWKEANFISNAILNMFSGPNPSLDAHGSSKRPVITDGTANVGGNSISFHLNGFERVQSVEIDLPTCQMLKNNLEVYHCPTDGVLC